MSYDRAVILHEEKPSMFTVKVGSGFVSGGDLVMFYSGTDIAGSGTAKYDSTQIQVIQASGTAATKVENILGVALATATGGQLVNILTHGVVSLPTGSLGVTGGQPVWAVGYANCVESSTIGSIQVAITTRPIGRALSSASAEGKYVWVLLDV